MVKESSCYTAEDSDADDVQVWMEEAPTRRSAKRGKYKTMNGVPCKTEQEKKASKAVSNKKWRLAQKTKASKMLAEKKKLELSVMHKTSKATVTKKLVA